MTLIMARVGKRKAFFIEGCEVYAALCGLFGLVSIVTLTAIAVERCLVISVKPWHGTILFTHSKAKVAIGVVWFYCLALVLPPLALGWGAFVPEGFLTSCSFDYLSRTSSNRAYFLYLFCFGFFVPVLIISVCYSFILQTIFQNERDMKLNQITKFKRSKVKKNEYRAAEMILMVIALFLISWTPYSLIACLGQFGDKSILTPWVSILPSLFAKMSTLYNPAIYGLSHRHFRATLRRICKRDIKKSRSGTYCSRNSSITRSRTGCPCLRINGASDVLENSTSSITGKKIYVASHQDNSRLVYVRKSRVKNDLSNLCLPGGVGSVLQGRHQKSMNDSTMRSPDMPSSCLHHIPGSCGSFSDFIRPLVPDSKSVGEPMSQAKDYDLVKLCVLDPKFGCRLKARKVLYRQGKFAAQKKPIGNCFKQNVHSPHTCLSHITDSCQSCNDFVKLCVSDVSISGSKGEKIPDGQGEASVSTESDFICNTDVRFKCLRHISQSSVTSCEFCNDINKLSVSKVKSADSEEAVGILSGPGKATVEKRPMDPSLVWPSTCRPHVPQSSSNDSCDRFTLSGMNEFHVSKTNSDVESNGQNTPSTQNSNDIVEMCVLQESGCENLSLKSDIKDHAKQFVVNMKTEGVLETESLSHRHENFVERHVSVNTRHKCYSEPFTCLQHVPLSCGPDNGFTTVESKAGHGLLRSCMDPSLVRSLMFRSERSIQQKYQTLLERDHIVKVPTVVCFCCNEYSVLTPKSSKLKEKKSSLVPENRKVTVISDSGHTDRPMLFWETAQEVTEVKV